MDGANRLVWAQGQVARTVVVALWPAGRVGRRLISVTTLAEQEMRRVPGQREIAGGEGQRVGTGGKRRSRQETRDTVLGRAVWTGPTGTGQC